MKEQERQQVVGKGAEWLGVSEPSALAEIITEAQSYEQIEAIVRQIKSNQQPQLWTSVRRELQNMLVVHPENIYSSSQFLSLPRLQLIRDLFVEEERLEGGYFQNESGFVLIAVTSGFLLQSAGGERITRVKQYFGRNVRKEMGFWGLTQLESLQNYLCNASTGYFPYHNEGQHELQLDRFQFFLEFVQKHSGFFPISADLWSILFKVMLCLKEERQRDKVLFQRIKAMYFNDRYHFQTTLKNMKFALEFFKNPFAQKDCLYNPPKSINAILERYSVEQLQSLLQNSSMGLTWDTVSVFNFFVACIKLGITETTTKVMVGMIRYCEKKGKYNELIQNYEKNFEKLFIFLKYPKLFPNTSQLLKHFFYSPPPQVSFYQKFVDKAIPLVSSISKDIFYPYLNILQTVAYLYKDTTNVLDLNAVIDAHTTETYARLTEEEMKQEIALYSWKNKVKVKAQGALLQKQSGYKGLTNIGNSCYMNSFLQALFMNREFTKAILSVSTLQLERQRLKQPNLQGSKDLMAISKQIREEMRPLAELQRLFALLLQSKRTEVSAGTIRNVAPSQFRNNYQHDSIEFGRLFLEMLYKNKISKIFEGQMTTAIQCDGCKQVRQRKEEFLDLIVSPQRQEETLEETLAASFSEEVMQDLQCDFCGEKRQNSIKRHFVSKCPNYLIVSIKRFEYCVAEKKNRKSMAKIVIRPSIRLNDEDYDLYSLIIHRGPSSNAGHYFAFSKYSFEPNCRWVCHNDSEVSELESYKEVTEFLDNNESDTPYILFFERRQHIAAVREDLMKPIVLRKPLEEFVQRDFLEEQKAKEKKVLPLFNPINFAAFFKKDDDEDEGGHNQPFYNNYIL